MSRISCSCPTRSARAIDTIDIGTTSLRLHIQTESVYQILLIPSTRPTCGSGYRPLPRLRVTRAHLRPGRRSTLDREETLDQNTQRSSVTRMVVLRVLPPCRLLRRRRTHSLPPPSQCGAHRRRLRHQPRLLAGASQSSPLGSNAQTAATVRSIQLAMDPNLTATTSNISAAVYVAHAVLAHEATSIALAALLSASVRCQTRLLLHFHPTRTMEMGGSTRIASASLQHPMRIRLTRKRLTGQ